MSVPRTALVPDELNEGDIPRSLQNLRRFLTQRRIDQAEQALAVRAAGGNRFRQLVLSEKQPWPSVFDWFDRKTLRGARPLRRRDTTRDIVLAALAGRMLDRIELTLTPRVADQMRAHMLDLDGRTHPVMMEWSAANFYLRRGFAINWTEPGIGGPEFVATGHGLAFGVECKRITRNSKEKLGDRHALTMGNGILRAVADEQLAGDLVLNTTVLESPAEQEVTTRVSAALRQAADVANIDVQLPHIGHLTARLSRLGPGSGWAQRVDIERRMAARPHDHRGFAIAIPHAHAPHPEAAVLWLRGPRSTEQEHINHMKTVALEGAHQLGGASMGVLVVEVEDVTDATLFRDRAAFRDITQAAFAAQPALGALIWRGQRSVVSDAAGVTIAHPGFAERNPACRFDAAALPLLD